jgi:hypothetical protein
MSDKKYNGWENYETWNVALWLSNDQGSYYHCREIAQNADSIRDTAEQIKDMVEENNPTANDASMFSDLLGHALQNVNWHEVAESFIED